MATKEGYIIHSKEQGGKAAEQVLGKFKSI